MLSPWESDLRSAIDQMPRRVLAELLRALRLQPEAFDEEIRRWESDPRTQGSAETLRLLRVEPVGLTVREKLLRARVGVRADVRLHDLRALYVTEALAAGIDPGIESRQAGHSTVSFTFDVYQRVRREDARAAADAIDRVLGDVISEPKVDEWLTGSAAAVVQMRERRR